MYHKEILKFGNDEISIETGKIARQADGSIFLRWKDAAVLCTVVFEKTSKPGLDFFPLSVFYQEKSFAAGRIPGGFVKREGKPSDKETLVSRLIDRPIRPLFPKDFRNETQIIATVMSYDPEVDTEVASIIAASAALSISGIPFLGPVGASRVGYQNGKFILGRSIDTVESKGHLDLVVAGTAKGILMVESEANELSEDIMLEAIEFGHKSYLSVIDGIEKFKERCSKEIYSLKSLKNAALKSSDEDILKQEALDKELYSIKSSYVEKLESAFSIKEKIKRYAAFSDIKDSLKEYAIEKELPEEKLLSFFDEMKSDFLRQKIIKNESRIDGRKINEIRPISSEVSILPRTHGSALFTRGETQVIVAITLGASYDEQIVDNLGGEKRESFLLHYNFPPYSVGETGRMGAPGRREIGHGKLAFRAINPIFSKIDFEYTVRVVSEVTESNGSSSMATICGTSLSLMDAGVPIEKHIAGIAMGLVKEGDKAVVLSDILGDEDHLGDMDFKVAGTRDGITSLQMDLKIDSITPSIMKDALIQAKEGRLFILNEMYKTIESQRSDLSKYAPRIMKVRVNQENIRDLIGPGGKTIKELCEKTKTKIEIDNDGLVLIFGVEPDLVNQAFDYIVSLGSDPEVGASYDGIVTKVLDFGALVRFMGAKEGMVHISEIAEKRVENISDVISVGDKVKVKVIQVEPSGRIKLSIKKAK